MVRVLSKGCNLNSDDHSLYASNFVNNNWRSLSTNHGKKEWVHSENVNFPANLKAHGNTAEQYNDHLKTLRRVHRGLGRVNNGIMEMSILCRIGSLSRIGSGVTQTEHQKIVWLCL